MNDSRGFALSAAARCTVLVMCVIHVELGWAQEAQPSGDSVGQLLAMRYGNTRIQFGHVPQNSCGLILMRSTTDLISEKDLPKDISFPDSFQQAVGSGKDLSQPNHKDRPASDQKDRAAHSFAMLSGDKMFVLFDQPKAEEQKLAVVPVYGVNFNADPQTKESVTYGGTIAATRDPKEILVSMVEVVNDGDWRIVAYAADLSEPYAFGLYDGQRVRLIGEHLPVSTPLISQFSFKNPAMQRIVSVDSMVVRDDNLLVVVRFHVAEETPRKVLIGKMVLRLNLQTKEWTVVEEESPAAKPD